MATTTFTCDTPADGLAALCEKSGDTFLRKDVSDNEVIGSGRWTNLIIASRSDCVIRLYRLADGRWLAVQDLTVTYKETI